MISSWLRTQIDQDAVPGYAETFNRIRAQIGRDGSAAVLNARLPELISGWYRHTYHPFIRLGYGVEFNVDSEIAAGLAYLSLLGSNPTLAHRADQAMSDSGDVDGLFAGAAACQLRPKGRMFDERANLMIDHPAFAALILPQSLSLRALSRTALKVFAATSDFFALHLVTASHAWRALKPYIGPDREPRQGRPRFQTRPYLCAAGGALR
ncbi:MAG: questin oxidase family protein [Proteobacteria bacterium]|nr:questin oxidase family protein [Pseudomonadota bacterium]